MSQYPPDEFDDVPEDGPRQGAHRGRRRTARVGSGELTAIVVAGVLSLGVGAYALLEGAGDTAPAPAVSSPQP